MEIKLEIRIIISNNGGKDEVSKVEADARINALLLAQLLKQSTDTMKKLIAENMCEKARGTLLTPKRAKEIMETLTIGEIYNSEQ